VSDEKAPDFDEGARLVQPEVKTLNFIGELPSFANQGGAVGCVIGVHG
jgi:hypothetical protein